MLAMKLWCGSHRRNADRLTLEVANRVDTFGSKQLEAADMHAAQQHERRRQIQLDDVLRNKSYAEINAVGPYRAMVQVQRDIHVADIGESLEPQQLLGDVLRGDANPGSLGKTNSPSF